MGKTLIIAEKPSVSTDIARVLSVKKSGDVFENDEYVISAAVGHLVGLAMPKDIDKKLGFWTLSTLPIIPEEFILQPIQGTKAKFTELKKLINRKDVDTVINACDAGREGELIFTYIAELAKCKKPIKRLWMQSMTKQSIIAAFESLRPGEQMKPLADAARSRSESDWLIGINGTRASTKRLFGKGQVATVGRVQTPTLALVWRREQEIKRFIPRAFWKIEGKFGVSQGNYTGTYQRPSYKKGDDQHDRVDRLWQSEKAAQVVTELMENPGSLTADVTEKKTRSKSNAPMLYDLTTLQREANRRFGYSATRTLQIAQALYEKHKVLTYPRTDSRALPEDYISIVKSTLGQIGGHLSTCARFVLDNNLVVPNKRIFNNAKISDHFAIIPTGERPAKLSSQEENIYDMVTSRFIAVFYPAAEYDNTTRISKVKGHSFKTEGKILVKPGWLTVYGKAADQGDTLPALSDADGMPPTAAVLNVSSEESSTKPPARQSEATLLSAMENAGKMIDDEDYSEAMKEKGLGTPATRASTIEHLCDEKYMERDGRELIPTTKADTLITFLERTKADFLTQAELTGEWEHKLSLIEQGQLERSEFMKGIVKLTEETVGKIKEWEDAGGETAIVSPTDKKTMLEKLKSYNSQDGVYVIYKSVANRTLTPDEVQELVNKREIGPFDNFRSKMGRPFSAKLILDDENKVKFVFDDQGDGEPTPDTAAIELCGLFKGVKYNEPEKRGKRVYDDSEFIKSLADQATKRMLSERQVAALKKTVEKYVDQISNYDEIAAKFGLTTAADAEAAKAKISKLVTDLASVTEWDEPTGKGRAKKDDSVFYDSVKNQFEKKGALSPKQLTALEKMHGKYCK